VISQLKYAKQPLDGNKIIFIYVLPATESAACQLLFLDPPLINNVIAQPPRADTTNKNYDIALASSARLNNLCGSDISIIPSMLHQLLKSAGRRQSR
jgi:hypothetical protein